jgi:cytochrome c-type biogenesis protein CcmH
MFVAVAAVLILVVALSLSTPLWRRAPDPFPVGEDADQNQEQADLSIEREVLVRSLSELDVELAQGRLTPHDHARLKATDERRLLQVLDRLEQIEATKPVVRENPSSARPTTPSWIGAVAVGTVVVLAASGTYVYIQWQSNRALSAIQPPGGPGAPDPRQMVARLEARLRANPNDLEGQIMAGRSYQALERVPEAKQAWEKVLKLDPKNDEAHYHVGVILINTRKFDDPELFKTALAHFDAALVDVPMEPAVNWYRGLALWYLKHYTETDAAWSTAAQNLPPGSDDAEFVKAALVKLRAGQAPF